jgi:hypothetical protein
LATAPGGAVFGGNWVLAIIAYKQPIARSAIERVRGSNTDSAP